MISILLLLLMNSIITNPFNYTVIDVPTIDMDGDVRACHYVKCSDDSSSTLKSCRGLVYNGNTLILRAFPYTEEYTLEKMSKMRKEIINTILSDQGFSVPNSGEIDVSTTTRFFEAHEGTMLRVFYTADKWYVSTQKKLDASRSRWGSKETFGEKFERALGAYVSRSEAQTNLDCLLKTLDPLKQYIFLLRTEADNRIVCMSAPGEHTVYHIATLTASGKETYCDVMDLDDNIGLPKPKEHSFSSIDTAFDFVEDSGYDTIQGLMVMANSTDATDLRHVKLINSRYDYYQKVRCNSASIKFRYLEARNDTEMVEDLIYLYPEYEMEFIKYERALRDVATLIFRAYKTRYIYKEHIVVGQDEYRIMKECHAWHHANRSTNRISYEGVKQMLDNQSAPSLNRMIKRILAPKEPRESADYTLPTDPTGLKAMISEGPFIIRQPRNIRVNE